ncbi:MAG: hypothetical protein KC506_02330 [Nanoarchaeota archaeon]|nr:hypothetical protein [Nanoarchaeota archaeon]
MINPIYLQKEIIQTLKKELSNSKSNSIVLNKFLTKETYDLLKQKLQKTKFSHKKAPDKFSFSQGNNFEIKDVSKFLKNLTSKKFSNFTPKKFSHKDYTLIHDSLLPKKQNILAIIFVTKKWNLSNGGNLVSLKKEKTFVYPPKPNTLVLIKQAKKQKSFIQYVNCNAKNKSFYILEAN